MPLSVKITAWPLSRANCQLLLRFSFYVCVCVSACMYVHVDTDACGGQRRASDSQSCTYRPLWTAQCRHLELTCSSATASNPFSTEPSSSPYNSSEAKIFMCKEANNIDGTHFTATIGIKGTAARAENTRRMLSLLLLGHEEWLSTGEQFLM